MSCGGIVYRFKQDYNPIRTAAEYCIAESYLLNLIGAYPYLGFCSLFDYPDGTLTGCALPITGFFWQQGSLFGFKELVAYLRSAGRLLFECTAPGRTLSSPCYPFVGAVIYCITPAWRPMRETILSQPYLRQPNLRKSLLL
jgi:hypothetical protein